MEKNKINQIETDENILENKNLQEILTFDRFYDYLMRTKKYKDFFWSKEALVCFVLTIIIDGLLIQSALYSELEAINVVREMIPVFIGGLLTILGLSLSGLAIVTATLGREFLTTIIKQEKLETLFSIVFNFYFAGFIIGFTVVTLSVSYVLLSFKISFSWYAYITFSFINVYLVIFSIIYSIMLLGTCIRLFLTKYVILKSAEQNKDI